MSKVTMIGCDLHDRSMMLKVAVDAGKPVTRSFPTANREKMIVWIKDFAKQHGTPRIVFAHEASGQGFGLYDELTDAGIECYVLAPTHLPYTTHRRKNKTDEKDAQMILDEVRAHVLAGRKLPSVWVPDLQTRDDRETVRMRLQLGEQRSRIKNQIRALVKRAKLAFPSGFTTSGDWSRYSVQWLRDVAAGKENEVGVGIRTVLASLIDLYEELGRQLKILDQAVAALAQAGRYQKAYQKLIKMPGVGTLTTMVFLTELGDLDRFANRRQLAAYLGLSPSAFETGEHDDRKGHITRQGSTRIRHVLCQASWSAVRYSPQWFTIYERIKRGSQKRSKIAIVAVMRKLGITLWQLAKAQASEGILEQTSPQKTSARAQQKGGRPLPPHHRLGLSG